jgi:hypothetical protein
MLKILVATALTLAAVLPVNAQVGPGFGRRDHVSQNYRPQHYAEVCTKNHDGRLSLRTGPGPSYRKILEIPNRNVIGLNFGKYGDDGFWWWNTYHNGYQGWVRADYVCGDPQ